MRRISFAAGIAAAVLVLAGCETATPEEMAFAQLWDSLTEEERRLMVENADSVEIRQDSYIAVDAESQAGRNALAGDTADLEAAAARYGFVARLEDWCGGDGMTCHGVTIHRGASCGCPPWTSPPPARQRG